MAPVSSVACWSGSPGVFITRATAPTLTNDMRGVFLAKALGATTVAVGTHVTVVAEQTLRAYPALDLVVRGEPEETVQELVPIVLAASGRERSADAVPADLTAVRGLARRRGDQVILNPDRPFIADLDSLPIPRHELLPLAKYRAAPFVRR